MEKEVKIKTPDKHTIYGTLRTPKRKSGTLLVFAHGLAGHQNEHIFYNGARYFSNRGINTFRFDFYSGEKGGRVLTKCGISTHAKDLDTVVKHFQKQFKKIFVAGHSLGGITVLSSNTEAIDGIILWDSSRRMKGYKEFRYNKKLSAYIIKWGTEILMGKKMYEEWAKFPLPSQIASKTFKPLKVIVAGKGILVKAGRDYYKYANKPKEFAIIKGAGHNFNEDDTAEKLFQETYSFIKKFK